MNDDGQYWSIGSLLITGTVFQGSALGSSCSADLLSPKIKVICPYMQEESNNLHYSYNTTEYTDPYLKSLVQHLRRSHTHTLRMYKIIRSAAESLVHHNRLLDDHDFNAIAEDLGQST